MRRLVVQPFLGNADSAKTKAKTDREWTRKQNEPQMNADNGRGNLIAAKMLKKHKKRSNAKTE
jgi:hypothetical protein